MEWMQSGWFWWALAAALLAAEAMVPGIFLIWLGLAALATGLVRMVLPDISVSMQWIVFSLLSVVAVALAWRYRGSHPPGPTDRPLLNRRTQQLVGRIVMLDQPIVNGRGRVKIGDALWAVSGADLPAGTRVRVESVADMTLAVVAIEA